MLSYFLLCTMLTDVVCWCPLCCVKVYHVVVNCVNCCCVSVRCLKLYNVVVSCVNCCCVGVICVV